MSERLNRLFANDSPKKRKMLSPYITAGDPTPALTVPLLHSMVAAGADILELGIPFSDPMAEGPVIQAAMERALVHDVTLTDVLAMVTEFRLQDKQTPMILMGYANPIEFMGYETFAKAAAAAGVDGVIIVDLPPEEASELHQQLARYQIDIIFLLSPTTGVERAKKIAAIASGYIYYVTLKGVTGSDKLNLESIQENIARYRDIIQLPIMAGFGIKTPEQAAAVAKITDGVVVGAAVISRIAASLNAPEKICDEVASFLGTMRKALDV